MNTTIGSGQTSVTAVGGSAASNQTIYITRFVSEPIYQTSISANTWSLSVAFQEESTAQNFPVSGNNAALRINCYVWRPGGSKVGTILDGTTTATADESTSERASNVTFSGSSVTIQNGDVIIIEIWATGVTRSTSADMWFYYDGATVTTTDGAVSNHASFLETPENLNFTSTTTVTQTSIHKYNLLQYIPQTSIHKYNLQHYLLQTSIHKYNLRQFVTQIDSIQKYNLFHNILQTSIHKYSLKHYLLQSSIHKYNLKQLIPQTTIHKYNLLQQILTTSIHKYDIIFAGTLLVTSIHKYNLRAYLSQTSIHKYTLRTFVAATASVQKYALRAFVAQTNSIHKYNLRAFLTQLSIHKYNLKAYVTQTTIHKYHVNLVLTEIDMTEISAKSYANKFITRV